jgi:hypothetical protein
MAQTEILAAGNTASRSSEFVVGATPVSVALFVAVGGPVPSGVQLALERKVTSTGLWQPVFDDDGSAIYLGNRMQDCTIYGPGRYSLYRTANASLAVGAIADDAT